MSELIIEVCHPDGPQEIHCSPQTPAWTALDQALHLWEQLGQRTRVRVLRRLNKEAALCCVCHFPPADEPEG